MPIESSSSPLRRAILAVSAKCGAGASSIGRDAHQAGNRQAVAVAAGGEKGVHLLRRDARLLRLGAGIDLDEQKRAAPLARDLLGKRRREARRGRPNGWHRTAPPPPCALFDCSGPTRCSSRPPWRARSGGHLALASCTRFSPKTRWPAAMTGSIASAPKVFGDRDQGHARRIAPGITAGAGDFCAHRLEPGRSIMRFHFVNARRNGSNFTGAPNTVFTHL